MTLEEAIKHADEVADRLENSCKRDWMGEDDNRCAEQHRQLSMWLRELQEYRKIIPSVSEYLNASNKFVSVDETVDE